MARRYGQTTAVRARPLGDARPDRARLLRWLVYSAIPASLLLGTTTFIITDIASVPLLWIIPLTLYIGSLILASSARDWRASRLLPLFFPFGLATLACTVSHPLAATIGITPVMVIVLALVALFTGCLVFHRRLHELRPTGEDSGLFYVVLALGGALGGCFNSFVAPNIFRTAAEFPLVLALGLLIVLLPEFLAADVVHGRPFPRWTTASLLLLLAGASPYISSGIDHFAGGYLVISGSLLLLVLLCAFRVGDWLYGTLHRVLAATLVAAIVAGYMGSADGGSWLYSERNFFGISRVQNDVRHARLVYTHGVTIHGLQSTDPRYRLNPTSYYGPLREVFANLPGSVADAPVAVLGLGVGTVACYAKPGQRMDFYEIDPASIHIATDPKYFTYMRDCPGKRRIIVGDGRLGLARASDGRYGFIIMDAFTSDAIPVHLLTLQALRLYGRKLRPDGLIAFNVSNRYLDLLPVLRTLSERLGWTARYRFDRARNAALEMSSVWVVLAKRTTNLEAIEEKPGWKKLPLELGRQYLWTDGYSNLLGVLRVSDWTSGL